jgi:hypothetical protein
VRLSRKLAVVAVAAAAVVGAYLVGWYRGFVAGTFDRGYLHQLIDTRTNVAILRGIREDDLDHITPMLEASVETDLIGHCADLDYEPPAMAAFLGLVADVPDLGQKSRREAAQYWTDYPPTWNLPEIDRRLRECVLEHADR